MKTIHRRQIRTTIYLFFYWMLLLTNQISSQVTVNGSISNYSINCGSSSCEEDVNSSARHYYVAPVDGMLVISGFAAPGTIQCCGVVNQMTCSGGFRKLQGFTNVHNFSPDLTTGTLDCVMAGDSIELNFSGTFGTYGYNASVIPTQGSADPEPNTTIEQAYFIEANNSYSGHVNHGIYQLDAWDYIGFEAPGVGKLSIDISHTEDEDGVFQIGVFRNDGIFTGSTRVDTNPFVFEQDCLSQGDTIYLRLANNDCMAYFFDVNFLLPTFGDDIEPNDDTSTALMSTDIFGSVGHNFSDEVLPDREDYYQLPPVAIGDELTFNMEVVGGPIQFRLRSAMFSGFVFNLGVAEDETIVNSFQPTFDGIFYLVPTSNTGICGDYKVELSGCVEELFLSGSQSQQIDIESGGFIHSSQEIESGANIQYDAADYIFLDLGFQVNPNAIFLAFIDGCD